MKNLYLVFSMLIFSSQFLFAQHSIGGTIAEVDGTPIENAKVFLSDSVFVFTDSMGRYLFTGLESGDYIIRAMKDGNLREELSILDAYAIRPSISQGPGSSSSPPNDSLTSYQTLVANINELGEFDFFDRFVLRMIINKEDFSIFEPIQSWSFISTNFQFDKLLNEQIVEYELTVNLETNSFNNNFYGFNPGNVVKETEFIETDIKPIIQIDTAQACGDEVTIPIKISNLQNIIAAQFEVKWDTSLMEIANPIILTQNFFNAFPQEAGFAAITCYNFLFPTAETEIINLTFKIKGASNLKRAIEIDPISTKIQFLNSNLELSDADFSNGVIIGSEYEKMSGTLSEQLIYHPCGPIPTEYCVETKGGKPPYTYDWATGKADSCQVFNAPSDLSACTITDDIGCELIITPISFWWEAGIPISITVDTILNIWNSNSSNGKIIIAPPTGGTPPYQIVWSNGQEGLIAENLTAGSHFVVVRDREGCLLKEYFDIETTSSTANLDFLNTKITLFPNPISEGESPILKIENPDFQKGNIFLINISGKTIWERKIQNETLLELPDHLSKGLYFISVSFENGNQKTLKWIVK